MSSRRRVRLSEVAQIVTGATPSSKDEDNWGSGAAFLTPSDMTGIDYRPTVSRRLTPAAADRLKTRMIDQEAVAVVCIGATIGKVALISEPTITNQQINTLIPHPEVLDPIFCFYLLQPLRTELVSIASGSATPILNKTSFSKVEIDLPELDEQRRIANALGGIDDLIQVNMSLVRSLDEALQASWTRAVRTTSFEMPFSQVAEVSKGLSYKGSFLTDKGLPMINMGSFGVDGTHRLSGLKWYLESEVREKNRLVKGDLVVVNTDLTQTRDILARPIIVPFEHATSTHHTFQVRVQGSESKRFWLYCALRQEKVRQRLIAYATGTTVAALPLDALTSQQIPWEEDSVIEDWWESAEPLYKSQLALLQEISELISTRDTLLPVLLSGRATVSEVMAS